MPTPEQLAEQFEARRDHLRAVAYRMLGSATEAEDALRRPPSRSTRCARQAPSFLEHGLSSRSHDRRRAAQAASVSPVPSYGAVTTTALHSRPPLRRYACGMVESK